MGGWAQRQCHRRYQLTVESETCCVASVLYAERDTGRLVGLSPNRHPHLSVMGGDQIHDQILFRFTVEQPGRGFV